MSTSRLTSKDFKPVAIVIAFALSAAGGLLVLGEAVLPDRFHIFVNSIPGKLIQFMLFAAVLLGLAVQVLLYIYVPTPRRLVLTLIRWAMATAFLAIGGLSVAAIAINYSSHPGGTDAHAEFNNCSVNWPIAAIILFSFIFVYLLATKYVALHGSYLDTVDRPPNRLPTC